MLQVSPKPLFAILVTLVLTLGCSRSNGLPPTFPVKGTVSYNGSPISGATVSLVTTDAKGRSASGITNEDGEFSVKTYLGPTHEPLGAIAGEYKVAVFKEEIPKVNKELSNEEMMKAITKNPPKPKNLLPPLYRNPEKSGFRVTVEPNTQDLMLELKD